MTDARDAKAPSQFTIDANASAGSTLSLDDPGDWERATLGKIAEHPTGAIEGPMGLAWNTADISLVFFYPKVRSVTSTAAWAKRSP